MDFKSQSPRQELFKVVSNVVLNKKRKFSNSNLLKQHLEYKKKLAQRLKMKLLWSMNYYSKDLQNVIDGNEEFKVNIDSLFNIIL